MHKGAAPSLRRLAVAGLGPAAGPAGDGPAAALATRRAAAARPQPDAGMERAAHTPDDAVDARPALGPRPGHRAAGAHRRVAAPAGPPARTRRRALAGHGAEHR